MIMLNLFGVFMGDDMRVKENNEKNTVDFEKLEPGDCFRYGGKLHIKSDYEQDSVCLTDGAAHDQMCGNQVTPVNAEVQIID